MKDQKASVLQLSERIEFVDSIPLTPTGKINKLALKADIRQKLGIDPDQGQNRENEMTCH